MTLLAMGYGLWAIREASGYYVPYYASEAIANNPYSIATGSLPIANSQ
jgi:hypothetical protein